MAVILTPQSEVMASWFSWSDPYYRRPRREPSDVVVNTLMLEFSWQLKEAERQQRERESEYRRLKTGVDYSWLASPPRTSYSTSTGERLALEDLCCKVPPADCGLVILKYVAIIIIIIIIDVVVECCRVKIKYRTRIM